MVSAVILSEGFLGTTYGKTANGLCRFSRRFQIKTVIDSTKAGLKIEDIVPKADTNIRIVRNLKEAIELNDDLDTLIVGVATDGGFLPENFRHYITEAIEGGINIVSGLHEFVSDDPEFSQLALKNGTKITDVRKMFMLRRDFFTGRIFQVKSKKIAVLGTDSAIGKRTTAVYLNEEMKRRGKLSVMIGTGQTAWMQGFPYTVVIDSMINDFMPGGIESTIVEAWEKERPDFMFLEGQGSVIHPAYPGSFELIAAGKPDAIVLQHAPKRLDYDGFDGIRIPPLDKFIRILEELSDKKVIAISINRENMEKDEMDRAINDIEKKYGVYAFDPLSDLKKVGDVIESKV